MGLHRAYMHASLGFFVSWQCLICNRPPARRHRFRSLLLWNKVSHDFSLSPFVLLSLVVLCPNTRRSHQRFFFFFSLHDRGKRRSYTGEKPTSRIDPLTPLVSYFQKEKKVSKFSKSTFDIDIIFGID